MVYAATYTHICTMWGMLPVVMRGRWARVRLCRYNVHVIMALWFGGCGARMEWKSIRETHESERKSREQILTFAERHYRCTVKRNGLKINNTIQMYIYVS